MLEERTTVKLKRPLDELAHILDSSYLLTNDLLKEILAPRDFRIVRTALSRFNLQATDKEIADILIRNGLLPIEVEIYNVNDHGCFGIFGENLLDLMANLGAVPPQKYDDHQFPQGREVEHLRSLLAWDGKDIKTRKIPELFIEFSRPTRLKGISVAVVVDQDGPRSFRVKPPLMPIRLEYVKIILSSDAYSIEA